MTSNITPSSININYPVSGVNQSSAGFRTNFSAIRNQFTTARTEISNLQSTSINVSGDMSISGSIPVIGTGTTTTLNIKLNSILSSSYSIDTSKQDAIMSIGSNGLISAVQISNKPEYSGLSTPTYTSTKNTLDPNNPNSTGIASLTVPLFEIGTYGNVISSSYTTISDFGLLGYSIPVGNLIVGGAGNLSTCLDVGTNGQFLVVDSTQPNGIKWETISYGQGDVLSVSADIGLKVTGTSEPVISFDIPSLTESTAITGEEEILLSVSNSYNKIAITNLDNLYFSKKYITSVANDTSPSLGGNLNVGSYNIESTGNLNLLSGSTGNIILDSIVWPNSIPTVGSYLSVDSKGNASWSQITNGMTTLESGVGMKISTSNGTTLLSFDPSTIVESDTITSDASMVVYEPESKSTLLYPIEKLDLSITGSIFVSNSGDDTNGNGSINSPYKTITQALSVVESGNCIILMSGYYEEDLTITTSNISIKSFDSVLSTQISGNIIIGKTSGLTMTIFEGLYITSTSGTTIGTGTVNDSIIFKNCVISSSDSTNTQSGSTITLTGSISDRVDFIDCSISGVITNSTTSGSVNITNSNSIYDYQFRLVVNSGNTIVNNISKMLSISHIGGNLFVYNVDSIFDSYATTNTFDEIVYYPTVTSTSNSVSDLILLSNCSLYNPNYNSYGNINKTGTCPYVIKNITRLEILDTLTGTCKFITDNWDFGYQIYPLTASVDQTYEIDTNHKCCSYPVNSDITLSLSTPSFSEITSYQYDFKLILIGNGSSEATFDSNIIFANGANPYMDVGSSIYTLYSFIWNSLLSSWVCYDSVMLENNQEKYLELTQLNIGNNSSEVSTGRSIAFQTSGKSYSYDSRIYASSPGVPSESGQGTIEIQSSVLAIDGQLNVKNNAFNLGLQAPAGETYVALYSSGGDNPDCLIQSYGGSTTSPDQGTLSLIAANVTITSPYIDMTSATSGVMMPSTSNGGLTTGDNSAKSATTEWCNSKFVPSIVSGTQEIITNLYFDGTNKATTINSSGWNGFLVGSPYSDTTDTTDIAATYIGLTSESVPYFYQLGYGKINLATASSSISLKENIEDSNFDSRKALNDINSIDLKSFDWKDNGKHVSMGMIAEQVEEVCGELVNNDPSGHSSINFLNLMARMIGAIQELTNEINDLKNR